MAREDLATLVVGYDDADAALLDFHDLAAARREHRVGDYEAAVVRRSEDGHDLVTTTVDARHRASLHWAGLGVIVGVVVSPAIATALLGAGLGALAGTVRDRVDAFNHADMSEVGKLVDDSEVNLIVVADETTLSEIATAAESRGRVLVPFSDADVGLLKREVQQAATDGWA
jgi:uncharacterized membrane protein